MRQLSQSRYDFLFVLLIASLVFIAFISYQKIHEYNDSVNLVIHTNEVKNNLNEALSSLKDAETGQRGYLLTKDSTFLKPYTGAEQRINLIFYRLDTLLRDNINQQRNLISLKALIGYRLSLLNKTLSLISVGQVVTVKDSLLLQGNSKMDEVRKQVTLMMGAENELLQQRIAAKNSSGFITPYFLLGLSLVSILALTFFFFKLRKEIKMRISTEEINAIQEAANKQIQESENNLRNTIMQAPVAMCRFREPNHILELANERMCEILGRPLELIINKPIFEAITEGRNQGFEQMLDGVYKTGDPFAAQEIPATLIRKGNLETIYVNFVMEPYRKPDGTINGVLAVVIDVTEQVLARRQIEENEQRIRLATESARLGTFEINLVNNTIIFSERLAQIFGLDPNKIWIHQDLKNALHPDDVAVRDKAHEIALQTGNLYYEARVVWKDGSVHWIRTNGRIPLANKIAYKLYGIVLDITEEKEAAQKLAMVREQMALILKMVPAAIQLRNSRGEVLFANDEAARMTGFDSVEEMILQKDMEYIRKKVIAEFELYDDADKPFELENIPTAISLSTGKPAEAIFKAVNKKTGDASWILSKSSALLDATGKVSLVISTNTDITQQKKGEEELKRFKHMADNATEKFILMNEDGSFAYLNNLALERWGYTREEAKYLRVTDIEPFQSDEIFRNVFAKAQKEKIPLFESIHKKKDGTTYPVEVQLGGLTLEGKPYIFAVARDITDRKKAENELKESEAKFRGLIETLPHLVWITDGNGQPVFASSSWEDYSGFNPYEVGNWPLIVHPDDMEPMTNAWLSSLESGNLYKAEARLKNKEGEYRWHVVEGVPLKNEAGKIYQWIGAFTDINEQKLKEQKKDEFISIASHEMKTPLTTAKGYLQILMLTIEEENPTAFLYANRATNAVERLHDLVAELLDSSKIQNGKLNYNFSSFDFNEMLNETVENIQQGTRTHTITKHGKSLHTIKGDKNRLQQVIINLLTNAIKYSPNANSVLIEVEEKQNVLQVLVRDYGLGMKKQHLDKIFDRYYRVEEHAVHFQGLGIGLYISYEIISRHDGKMWVESEPDKGSTFYFTIPIYLD